MGSASARHGSTRCRAVVTTASNHPAPGGVWGRPPAGNHPVRAASRRSTRDVTSGGTDRKAIDAPRAAKTRTPLRWLPVNTPRGTPIAVATIRADRPRNMVFDARSRMSDATGRRNRRDSPKSNRRLRDNQSAYCSPSGRSAPADAVRRPAPRGRFRTRRRRERDGRARATQRTPRARALRRRWCV